MADVKGKGRAVELPLDLLDQSMQEKLSRWRALANSKGEQMQLFA